MLFFTLEKFRFLVSPLCVFILFLLWFFFARLITEISLRRSLFFLFLNFISVYLAFESPSMRIAIRLMFVRFPPLAPHLYLSATQHNICISIFSQSWPRNFRLLPLFPVTILVVAEILNVEVDSTRNIFSCSGNMSEFQINIYRFQFDCSCSNIYLHKGHRMNQFTNRENHTLLVHLFLIHSFLFNHF